MEPGLSTRRRHQAELGPFRDRKLAIEKRHLSGDDKQRVIGGEIRGYRHIHQGQRGRLGPGCAPIGGGRKSECPGRRRRWLLFKGMNGGPVATRTPDLYRVKVAL